MPDDTPEPSEWSMPDHSWDDHDAPPLTDATWLDDIDSSLPSIATYIAPTPPPSRSNDHTVPPDDDGEDHTTYWPVDLAKLFSAGYEPQQPEFLTRTDGQPLMYRGKCHACNGEGESGKSWFMLIACLQAIRQGEHVLYLDYEDVAATTVTRLLALGATPEEVLGQLHYMEPLEATFTRTASGIKYTAAHADLHTIMDRYQPSLVIIDGVTEAMWKHMLDPDKNGEFTIFHDNFTKPLARLGAATGYIDHVVKDKEARGKYAIGGVHKYNAMDGAVYSFHPLTSFGVGQHGSTRIKLEKDRPGQLRQHTPDGKHIADLHLISDPTTHALTWEIRAPADNQPKFRPTHYMEQLYDWINGRNDQGEFPNARQIDDSGIGAAKYLRQARALLVAEGHVTATEGPRKSLLHRAAKPYREADDPLSDKYVHAEPGPADVDF